MSQGAGAADTAWAAPVSTSFQTSDGARTKGIADSIELLLGRCAGGTRHSADQPLTRQRRVRGQEMGRYTKRSSRKRH